MNRSSTDTRRVSLLVLGVILLVLNAACDSGGDGPLIVPIDDSGPIQNPVTGEFIEADGVNGLDFTLLEDTMLVGSFALDNQPQSASVTILSLPQHGLLTLRNEGLAFSYTPVANFHGVDQFRFASIDGRNVEVGLLVESVQDAPQLTADFPAIADQGRQFAVNLVATDGDGDALVFSASGLPAWLVLDSQSGLLSGVPQQEDIGVVQGMRFVVTDSTGLSDEIADVTLEVVDINDAPLLNLSQAPAQMYARETISFRTFPVDPDSDATEVSVEPSMYFDAAVESDTITLTANDVAMVTDAVLAIRARDEFGALSRELLDIKILPRTESGDGITVSGYKSGAGVHLVMLGDGYASDQQERFREHVDLIIDHLESDQGIADHLGAFNIHRIETVSNDSGADDRYQVDRRDTAYDSGYNCRSIPRLICADNLKVLEAALAEYPMVDQLILLVNDRRYGGSGNSGGRIAITSAFAPEIAIHEMGHSLANLADEYVDPLILESSNAPPFQEGSFPNVTAIADPASVPWAHWIDPNTPLPTSFGDDGVGVFEGGLYRPSGVFRPTFNSRMREFDVSFGPVNSEQWILRLYTLTNGVRDVQPQLQNVVINAGESQLFSVTPIFGLEVQTITWLLNGLVVEPQDLHNELELTLPAGVHELTMTVSDNSGAIRLAIPHAGVYSYTWSIRVL
ncbi:MAG: hypothetical protein KTR32_04650 [Granulosicoccus sp.]|nr:hypothetical protein [Granulosicoccus sp.]